MIAKLAKSIIFPLKTLLLRLADKYKPKVLHFVGCLKITAVILGIILFLVLAFVFCGAGGFLIATLFLCSCLNDR